MASKLFHAEVEVCVQYTIPVWAESLEEAANKAKNISRTQAEEDGECVDWEFNLVGVSRQTKRLMYQ